MKKNRENVGASSARQSAKVRPHKKIIAITLSMLLLLIVAIIIGITMTNAANNATEPETEQTFTEEGDGYYIWVRAVDHAGNKGPWSEAQRIWIDTAVPIVTCNAENNTLTIDEGDVITLADYFKVEPNGSNTNIVKTCTIGGTVYDTTEELTEGTYIVTCTATKVGGNSASETMIVVVKEIPIVLTATDIQEDTTKYKDTNGNKIVVPGGFKVRVDLATTIEEGIVIEDGDNNQFVWIPVGNVKKSDGTTVNIELGRYTFATDGTPELKQSADNYTEIVEIWDSFSKREEYAEKYGIDGHQELIESNYDEDITVDTVQPTEYFTAFDLERLY